MARAAQWTGQWRRCRPSGRWRRPTSLARRGTTRSMPTPRPEPAPGRSAPVHQRRVRSLSRVRHPGPWRPQAALRQLRPRQAAGLQLQTASLLPLMRRTADVADGSGQLPHRLRPSAQDRSGCPIGLMRALASAPRKVAFEWVTDPEAGRGFKLPNSSLVYRADDTDEAWARTVAFLGRQHPPRRPCPSRGARCLRCAAAAGSRSPWPSRPSRPRARQRCPLTSEPLSRHSPEPSWCGRQCPMGHSRGAASVDVRQASCEGAGREPGG